MTFVSEFAPHSLWRHFDHLLTIPRGSKLEAAARTYVLDTAAGRSLTAIETAGGNVVVRKPGTAGRETAASVVLQAHLDMVQEKNSDTRHDFATDPIRPRRDGAWLAAEGTTLGADNGIGVAAMLALMEDDELTHGPLEFLFTVDEETGLTGAKELPTDVLDSRFLINLDSEEDGVITIGCAGGGDTRIHLPLVRGDVTGGSCLEVVVGGLKGGHSGVDIHLQRGNAIRILARALHVAADASGLRIVRMSGGNARNAIPREATATIWLPDPGQVEICRDTLSSEFKAIASEIGRPDPGFRGSVEAAESPFVEAAELPPDVWDGGSTRAVLDLLVALPHGVVRMSDDLPGLVETSTNLAVVAEQEDGRLFMLLNSRSSVATALEALRRRIEAIARTAGATVEQADGYPSWQPDVESSLLAMMRDTYTDVIGTPPTVGAMHAGLECGIIGEKYPEMDMVSFGPLIEFPHSPDERVRIDTVEPFFRVLCATLVRVAGS